MKLILVSFGLENEQSLLPISHDTLVTFLILLGINLQNSTNIKLLILKQEQKWTGPLEEHVELNG